MPQLDDMLRKANQEVNAQKPPAATPTPTPTPTPTTTTTPPAAPGGKPLDSMLTKAKAEVDQAKKTQQQAAAQPWYSGIPGIVSELGGGARAGFTHSAMNVADLMRRELAKRSPAYRKLLEEQQRKYEAATPEQRKVMAPAYFGQAPEIQQLATPPPGLPGALGYGGEQMLEQYLASKAMPIIKGAGLLRGLLRVGEQAVAGGGMTGVQTGTKEGAKTGAMLGAAGGLMGEAAALKAAGKVEEALPWRKTVPLAIRTEAAERAVERGAVVPITREEEMARFPHLRPEIARFKGIVDDLTKRDPAISQRTIPIRTVMTAVNKMIRDVRASDPDIARALMKKRAQWMDALGFKPAEPAVPPTPARIVKEPVVDINGKPLVDRFGTPLTRDRVIPGKPGKPAVPAQTNTTVAEVQKLKESFGTALPESAFGQKPRAAAKIEAKLGTRQAARAAIETAVPERFAKYGDRTVAEMNRIMERNIRLKQAITDAVKRNPQLFYRRLPLMLGAEAAAGLLSQLTSTGREHRGEIAKYDLALVAATVLTHAYNNPLVMSRMLVSLRDSGVAIPATAYAAWRSAFEEPSSAAPARPPGPVAGVSAQPEIRDLLAKASRQHGVPLDMLTRMALRESGGDPRAVSNKGAVGVMQLMPGTAAELGLSESELIDPAKNIDAGARYLRKMLDLYHWDRELAAAAYNAGPGAVQKYGGVPPYRETQKYVRGVR